MFGRVLVFTLVEDAALVVWLALVRTGSRILGVLVLPIGFFVEHVIADNVKTNVRLFNIKDIPFGKIAVNAVVESFIWVVWLLLWPHYQFSLFGIGIPLAAIVWLQVALLVEHNLT